MHDDTVTTGQNGYDHKHAGMAGWSVPGYTELKALGSGGFGDVVLARHDASGTLVAIKYLHRKLLADPQCAGMFRAEAQVLASWMTRTSSGCMSTSSPRGARPS